MDKKYPFKDVLNSLGVNRQKKGDLQMSVKEKGKFIPKPKRKPRREPGIGEFMEGLGPWFKSHPIKKSKRLYKDEQDV